MVKKAMYQKILQLKLQGYPQTVIAEKTKRPCEDHVLVAQFAQERSTINGQRKASASCTLNGLSRLDHSTRAAWDLEA